MDLIYNSIHDNLQPLFDKIAIVKFHLLLLKTPVYQEEITEYFGSVSTTEEALELFQKERLPAIESSKDKWSCSDEKAILLFHAKRAYNIPEETAEQLVSELMISGLTFRDIKNLTMHIRVNEELIVKKMIEGGKTTCLIRAKDYHALIPRTLQIGTDGSKYLFFNKMKFQKDPLIGTGCYKKVKGAIHLTTARKFVHITMEVENRQTLPRDLRMALEITHDCFIKVLPSTVIYYTNKIVGGADKIGWIEEYFNGGDLLSALQASARFPPLTLQDRCLIAQTLLSGLDWLHTVKKAIHRDIKLANILLERDITTGKVARAVIADLGFSCYLTDIHWRSSFAATPGYASPECIEAFCKNASYLDSSVPPYDNWSCGMILYALFKDEVTEWRSLPPLPIWLQQCKTPQELHQFYALYADSWLPVPSDPHSIGHPIRGLLTKDSRQRWSAGLVLEKLKSWAASKII